MKKAALIVVMASFSFGLLSGCGEKEHVLNNWNCTEGQLSSYKTQEGVSPQIYEKFEASCKVKELGQYSRQWRQIKTKCFFSSGGKGQKCGDAERAALLEIWEKEA